MSSKRRNKKRQVMEKKRMEGSMTEHSIVEENVPQNLETVQEPPAAGAEMPISASPVSETVKSDLTSAAGTIQPDSSSVSETEKTYSASVSEASDPVQPAAAPDKQPTSADAPAKKAIEKNLYLQYNNLEFSDRLMFEAAINDYCQNTGASETDIEAVNLYVKPEEGKAYYVINHDGEKVGSIEL